MNRISPCSGVLLLVVMAVMDWSFFDGETASAQQTPPADAEVEPNDDDFSAWRMPSPQHWRTQMEDWVRQVGPGEETLARAMTRIEALAQSRERVEDAPEVASTGDLLGQTGEIIAMVLPQFERLVDACRRQSPPSLGDEGSPELVALDDSFAGRQLRLLYGRALLRARLYDESLAVLAPLAPKDVVDPAALAMARAVAAHQLLDYAVARRHAEIIERTAERAPSAGRPDSTAMPRRYAALAGAILQDLATWKEGSLQAISRQMKDVGRRLDLGRAGNDVQTRQEEVLAALDKLIENEEQSQQQQQQQAAAAQGAMTPANPADDSYLLGGKGRGDVGQRRLESGEQWGDLPEKDREAALQSIERTFPPHYRRVVEQFFQRMAE